MASRLLVVSNRLPVTTAVEGTRVTLKPADGGLASGMRPWHARAGGLWIGWPGDVTAMSEDQRCDLDRQLADGGMAPVHLSREHLDRYYHGFSNRVLWPLFHYLVDRVPVDATGWEAYRQVNEQFAATVAAHYQRGDTIWVHDYQLMLVPALLRRLLPEASIGFFLHIPFPSSELFRTLPWRREILNGLLGANLVGFHTFSYMRHFVTSLLHVDGVEAEVDRVRLGDHEVRLGVFPMGVDAARFAALAADADVMAATQAIRENAGGRQIVLGVDRLDYTKGIPRRLQAFERLLLRHPELRDRVRYLQVAVPSRGEVDAYQSFRRQVEETVGRINGRCGTLQSTPVHYVHQGVSERELVALYAAADVMLVTPLRDGMNLVAKEFVAARRDEDGVLILSEFAGAAAELEGALVVNPYDIDGVAERMYQALTMLSPQRAARMKSLRRRVLQHDVHVWARTFLTRLGDATPARSQVVERPEPMLVECLRATTNTRLQLALDYDGTLVPIARSPDLALPDADLLMLLEELSTRPGIDVHVVSGRPREALDEWFGRMPVSLWAEHGFWQRRKDATTWRSAASVLPDVLARVRPILEQFTESTPGSLIEEKSACIAWHYRNVPREFGARQAHELRLLLGDALSNQPLEVLEGRKVIEVRLRGIHKGLVAHHLTRRTGDSIVAIGDDRTDEDLFRALPPSSITIAVGAALAGARFTVRDHREVRQLLSDLLAWSRGNGRPATTPDLAAITPGLAAT